MRNFILIAFLALFTSAHSQGTISGRIFLPANWNSSLPKIAVYRGDTSVLEAVITVPASGLFTYNYSIPFTTYFLEPYFESFDTSKTSTGDANSILQEASLIDSPDGINGLFLQSGRQWFSSDIKNQKKLDLGQGYLVLRKLYNQTQRRSYPVVTEMICNGSFEINNPGANNYSIYGLTAAMCWKALGEQFLEVWGNGFLGIPAYNGSVYIEMNVNTANTYFQDFTVAANDSLTISFAHRSRSTTEQITATIGPVGGPQTIIQTSTLTPGNGWVYYTRGHKIPNNPINTTYRLSIISNTGGGTGNLLDAVSVKKNSRITTSYFGPRVDFFTETQFSQLSKNNWSTFQVNKFFPVSVTTGNFTLNFKYLVRGNVGISSL
jgi:hypothetical protein